MRRILYNRNSKQFMNWLNRILTKGGCNNAIEGKDNLKKLVEYANGKIIIIPGGGVTKENKLYLSEYISTKEVHGTKIVGNLI